MAAETATLCCTLLFVGVFVFVSGEPKNITADPGENVTLTCRAPSNNIIVVEWNRTDLGSEDVLLNRDGLFHPDNQHPSFKDRVDLQDRQMKDGDVSVILKNVTTNDTGTYECRVAQRVREPLKLLSIINLRVVAPPPGQRGGTTEDGGKEDGGKKDGGKEDGGKEDGGKKDGRKEDGSVGLIVGLSVPALLLVAPAVGFVIYRKYKQSQDPYLPPVELQPV